MHFNSIGRQAPHKEACRPFLFKKEMKNIVIPQVSARIAIGLMALVQCMAFAQVALGIYAMKYDIMDQFYPCRAFIAESLQRGELPLWNPYIYFGYPFYSDPQAGLHYPLVWVFSYVFAYSAYTMHLEFMLHVFLAGLAMYLIVAHKTKDWRLALLGGLSFSLSGVFVGNAQHLTWLISLAWLSMAAYNLLRLSERPHWHWGLGLGLSLAFSLTGGYPAFGFISAYLFIA